MRTIKFRAKTIMSPEWVHGDLLNFGNNVLSIGCYTPNGYELIRRVDPATVGQFTGLTDKAGREIYEGDILLWVRKKVHIEGRQLQDFSHRCKVYYDNDRCAFQFRCELSCGACVGNLDFDDDRADESYVEVIGNIHDNPEMLEKGGEQ